MSSAAQPNHLRLVGTHSDADDFAWRQAQVAKLAVVKENRLAASARGLHPADPRWVLALQTQARLQGATLTPESREQLVKSGTKLGLRGFEANLVIAIVQDRARAGLNPADAAPMLRLIGESAQSHLIRAPNATWPQWLAALAAALAICGLLMRWVAGG